MRLCGNHVDILKNQFTLLYLLTLYLLDQIQTLSVFFTDVFDIEISLTKSLLCHNVSRILTGGRQAGRQKEEIIII